MRNSYWTWSQSRIQGGWGECIPTSIFFKKLTIINHRICSFFDTDHINHRIYWVPIPPIKNHRPLLVNPASANPWSYIFSTFLIHCTYLLQRMSLVNVKGTIIIICGIKYCIKSTQDEFQWTEGLYFCGRTINRRSR